MLKQVQHYVYKTIVISMNKEELVEEGIIIKSQNGIAEVGLQEKAECEECSAKLFCSPSGNSNKRIIAVDPYDTSAGDKVRIAVSGKSVLLATSLLYGLPLLILIIVIIGGMSLFESESQPELFSFLTALTALGIYYSIFFLAGKKNGVNKNPAKIISVSKPV